MYEFRDLLLDLHSQPADKFDPVELDKFDVMVNNVSRR